MEFPKITFGIIVLNGEPFTRYCLSGIYPFAYQIIVVEGAVPSASSIATLDGHSSDQTLEILHKFKKKDDPHNKLTIVTAEEAGHPNGFWPGEKDEMSDAFTRRARGDYIWQVDIDEFYHPEDIIKILDTLLKDPSISGVSFDWKNFWGGFDYLADGWTYRNIIKKMNGNRRIFRWRKSYRYISHRPPTVIDKDGRDLCSLNWLGYRESSKLGIFCYHYGMVFPKQANQKTSYYQNMWASCKDMGLWYQETYLRLNHPYNILHGMNKPSWLLYFLGSHPLAVRQLIEDLREGKVTAEKRKTDDIEKLLNYRAYSAVAIILGLLYDIFAPLSRIIQKVLNLLKGGMQATREVSRRLFTIPLERLRDAPDLFREYRNLHRHPELIRKPGGWIYKDKFYPDYLTVGGASHSIFHVALKYCRGRGADIGAGYWPLPGAVSVDTNRGPGLTKSISDFADGSLDFIFSSHCLEHIADWKEVLSSWIAKLKSGGVIFLYLPHPDCTIWQPGSPFIEEGHKWIPTPKKIKRTLEGLDCEIVGFDDGPDAMYSFFICGRRN